MYLYQVVDSEGPTLEFLLPFNAGRPGSQALFLQSVTRTAGSVPQVGKERILFLAIFHIGNIAYIRLSVPSVRKVDRLA